MTEIPICEAAEFVNGRAFMPSDWARQGVPIIRIQNLTGTNKLFNYFNGNVEEKYLVRRGDILISWSASLGVYQWGGGDAILNQHIFKVVLKPGCVPSYFYYAASNALGRMVAEVHGSTMQHITKDRFDAITIPLPNEKEQDRIGRILRKADRLHRMRLYTRQLCDTFLQAQFLEVFGDPVINPKRWRIRDLASQLETIDSGWSPVAEEPRENLNEWAVLGLGSVSSGVYRPQENKTLPRGLKPKPHLEVNRGDVLITRKNTADLVAACVFVHHTPAKLMLPDTIFRFRFSEQCEVLGEYMWSLFAYPTFRRQVQRLATGSAGSMPNISKEKFMEILLPIPPVPLQQKFARVVNRFERLSRQQREAERQAEHLFQTLLQRAFAGELVGVAKSRTVKRKPSASAQERTYSKGVFYRRAAIEAYVINALRGDPYLGRTKLEKIDHLIEYHCAIDLERYPVRDAAGPDDYPSRMKLEHLADKRNWFRAYDKKDGSIVKYLRKRGFTSAANKGAQEIGEKRNAVDNLIELMRPLDTKRCEIIATLYAAWNDFLIQGKKPSDTEIVQDILQNWRPEKKLIPERRWLRGLNWMRDNGLVPRGHGKPVLAAN